MLPPETLSALSDPDPPESLEPESDAPENDARELS